MPGVKLGRLEEVRLREVWQSEPHDFTPWLADAENLQFLAESLELPGFQLVRMEHPVDSFSADIVCKVLGTDDFVLIENQLERTDHIHVGQILTYAAKFDAHVIVWVAQKFTEAHRAALDWLNLITADEYGFFGVEVRAVRIGQSEIAPLFDVVAKPNEWTKPELSSPRDQTALSRENEENIEFWSNLDAALETKGVVQRRVKKSVKGPNLWIPLASDGSVYIVAYRALSGSPTVGVYLGVYGEHLAHYGSILKQAHGVSEDPIIAAGNWEKNRTETVEKLIAEPLSIDGLDQATQIEWLVDRINSFAEEFQLVTANAQTEKPEL